MPYPYGNLEAFTDAYIECALWSSTDDEGNPLDQSDAEIAPETLAEMRSACFAFYNACDKLITPDNYKGSSCVAMAGHDFWLTRNGHGAGFWDGDWLEPNVSEELSNTAEAFGTVDLYVGDDGLIYGS